MEQETTQNKSNKQLVTQLEPNPHIETPPERIDGTLNTYEKTKTIHSGSKNKDNIGSTERKTNT